MSTASDSSNHCALMVSDVASGAIAIITIAYLVNAVFNHTAWGLQLKALANIYVFGFYMLIGVIVPAAYIGWAVHLGRAAGHARPDNWMRLPEPLACYSACYAEGNVVWKK